MTTLIERELTQLLNAQGRDIRRIIETVYNKISSLPPEEQIRLLRETSATVTDKLVAAITRRLTEASQAGTRWASTLSTRTSQHGTSGLEETIFRIQRTIGTFRGRLVRSIEATRSNNVTIEALMERIRLPGGRSPIVAKEIRVLIKQNGKLAGPIGQRVSSQILKRLDHVIKTPTDAAWNSLAKAIRSGNTETIRAATKWWIRDKTLYQLETIARTETIKAAVGAYEKQLEESGLVEEVEWVTADDDRVCDECQSLDGQRFPIGQGPRPGSIHPRCRCSIVAVLLGTSPKGALLELPVRSALIKKIVSEELVK